MTSIALQYGGLLTIQRIRDIQENHLNVFYALYGSNVRQGGKHVKNTAAPLFRRPAIAWDRENILEFAEG